MNGNFVQRLEFVSQFIWFKFDITYTIQYSVSILIE